MSTTFLEVKSTAEKIKELRLTRGLTLEQVANEVGVGKSTVRKWETGMIANMRNDKIKALAKTLGTTPEYLMGWEDAEKEHTPADQELSEMLETLRTREDMRMLFKLSKEATPEDVRQAVKIIEALRKND